MAIRMLNLVADRGQYIRLLNGVRFEHLGRIYDLRNISEADADALAADPACQFLGKKDVTKGGTPAPKTEEQPSSTPQKKAGDASVDDAPAAENKEDLSQLTKQEIIDRLTAANVVYDPSASKKELLALLEAGAK